MIHYTCDGCQRTIDLQREVRYIARVEVYAALDPLEEDIDDDRDHLQEIQDVLETLDDLGDAAIGDAVYHHQRYDLCSECRKRFVNKPLGHTALEELGFSQN